MPRIYVKDLSDSKQIESLNALIGDIYEKLSNKPTRLVIAVSSNGEQEQPHYLDRIPKYVTKVQGPSINYVQSQIDRWNERTVVFSVTGFTSATDLIVDVE